MSGLEIHIKAFFAVDDQAATEMISFFRKESLMKHDFFLKTGQYAHRLAYLESGLLREYLLVDGKEVTKWISGDGYFAVDLAGFLYDQPARWNIQALADCSIYSISKSDYLQLNMRIPQWPVIEKNFLARCFTILEDRVVSHLSMTAEQRFKIFFDRYPQLFNQVPLQYLASLLGMTPETLSRIRKKQIL